jgi:hypothetical protein
MLEKRQPFQLVVKGLSSLDMNYFVVNRPEDSTCKTTVTSTSTIGAMLKC